MNHKNILMKSTLLAATALFILAVRTYAHSGHDLTPTQKPTGRSTYVSSHHDYNSISSDHDHHHGPSGHEADEGVLLASNKGEETVYSGARCNPVAPVREYNVLAINVEVTLNRYLDYDPQGRMYVLEEDLERVRQEEAQDRAARTGRVDPAASLGLQGDAIQPLILRVNQGECLRIRLRNDLKNNEPASFHLHGSGLYLAATGTPAIATNPDAVVQPGAAVAYEWWAAEDEPEGTHYFHSHGNDRVQTGHGLFGALIVEPKGSRYVDPIRGGELRSGWTAIIQDPSGADFREFTIVYHEIGNERYRHLDRNRRLVPQVDPFTSAYRPGDRAINYRSEPFMNRMALQHRTFGRFDLSLAYSSYTFGEPATPIARSYLGDPVKQRVIHGGSEVFHVHHVHGGAIRWRRQPNAEPVGFEGGLDKHPALLPQVSERVDSQAVGPSEDYDLENECGSGGCQQSAGDYLIHCHAIHHYLAGMWMIWRVYNTLQDGSISLDGLPPLQELPDRLGQFEPAVTSQELVDRIVDWKGLTFRITRDNLAEWVERQLPPPGIPKGYDASVLDWRKVEANDRSTLLYLNEPDIEVVWIGFRSPIPRTRPPIYFDPKTGKLAYPFLRPHLGKRPPFAPNHGPAPFLDPIQRGTEPPRPGENGPWSLCPAGTKLKEFVIHAITLPITLSQRANLVDPVGQLYVLKEDEEAVRAKDGLKVPLAIRSNAGEDCMDVVFKSEVPDTRENAFFSKSSIHIHFVQFDVQGSDGLAAGFNYEQSVRPFTIEGETLQEDAASGETGVRLGSVQRFHPGTLVGVGMDQDRTFEIKRIKEIEGDRLIFDEPLRYSHAKGEIVSAEFLRHRWYPDVQFGTAFFHDHVDPLVTSRHGLFGALISEPPSSTYRDPHTGAEVRSGPVVDVHTTSVVSADVSGSFRELIMFIADDSPLTKVGNSSGSSLNLRVEPTAARGGDPSRLFSSSAHGDPATPLLEAFVGDPIVIRTLVAGTNDVHTFHVEGHWFRAEPFSSTSPPISTIHVGISERYDLSIPKAGGPQGLPGDYIYYNGRSFKLREGSWGIIRVYDGTSSTSLKKLPGHEAIPLPPPSLCPADAPLKEFAVAAIEIPLPMLGGSKGPAPLTTSGQALSLPKGKLYALQEDKMDMLSGAKAPETLVLRANVGDCIVVRLKNETPSGPVSFHAGMLAYDPRDAQAILPGEAHTYTYFAHPEVGETVALVRDRGNVLENPRLGLYGAIIVGPRGATYTDPVTGADMSLKASWRVDVHPPSRPSYRDFALFIQDEDEVIGTALMPYSEHVEGVVGLNYRAEPLQKRLAKDKDTSKVFRSDVHGDPSTPVMEAFAGDAVKIHVLVPFSEQAHVFTLEGHRWPLEPALHGSDLLSSVQVGGLETITIAPVHRAGGEAGLPGDYLYGDHREPYREAGLWGVFRVYAPGDVGTRLRPLPVR